MEYESTPDFDTNFLKLTKKNKALEGGCRFSPFSVLRSKILWIIENEFEIFSNMT